MDDCLSWAQISRRDTILCGSVLAGLVATAKVSKAVTGAKSGIYRVRLLSVDPPRFAVTADVPIDGDRLSMVESYPAELPEMAAGGWPSLIQSLSAFDPAGRPVGLTPTKGQGWRLAKTVSGRIKLSYTVDLTPFSKGGWTSPLESAVADKEHLAVCGRALFLTTSILDGARIIFDVPRPWRVTAPWLGSSVAGGGYTAMSTVDLTDNFIVFATRAPDVVSAAGFRMQITSMGHWQRLRPLVSRTLEAIIAKEVALMGYQQRDVYNVVLTPLHDTGGEAYRQSFVYAFEDPAPGNRRIWANTMAHEIFHYWNYARLQGAEYASTQWFQEGFTEYVADLTTVGAGIVSRQDFFNKLARHVANSRKLATTLEAIGTQKGPPLYSAGSLVAFIFDVMIRRSSSGRHDIGSFFRNLWQYTDAGARKYAWPDIEAALRGAAPLDWQGFYTRHIRGHDPLPLDRAFRQAGLRLGQAHDGIPFVTVDPTADEAAKSVLAGLLA